MKFANEVRARGVLNLVRDGKFEQMFQKRHLL